MIREGVKMLLRLYDTKHFPCSSLCSKLYSSVSCHYMKYSFSLSFCLDSCPTFTHSFLIPPWPFTMQYSFISGQGPEKKVHHRQGKNVISSLCNTGLCILALLQSSCRSSSIPLSQEVNHGMEKGAEEDEPFWFFFFVEVLVYYTNTTRVYKIPLARVSALTRFL